MRRTRLAFLIAAACLATLPRVTAAQVGSDLTGAQWILPMVASMARRSPERSALLDVMEQMYWKSEVDGVAGISRQDHDLAAQINTALRRMKFVDVNWLPYDLDGDGLVTRAEIDTVSRQRALQQMVRRGIPLEPTSRQLEEMQRELAERVLKNFPDDADNITLQDVFAAAERTGITASERRYTGMVPMALDRDGDASVSLEEFNMAVSEAFAMFDTDRDGVISKEEITAGADLTRSIRETIKKSRVQETKREAELAARESLKSRIADCGFPAVAADDTLILISTNSAIGRGLANIVLDDSGQPVVVAQIKVEPGAKNLFIALTSSRRTVWRFSGAVERIAQVVVGSGKALSGDPKNIKPSGISGLDPARVTMMKFSDCVPAFDDTSDDESELSQWVVAQLAGRAPDLVVAAGRLGTILLPSMSMDNDAPFDHVLTLPGEGDVAALVSLFEDYYPAGVIDIDPADVVTNGKARRLDVLPGNAGLAQLLNDGALEAIEYDMHYHVGRHRYVLGGTRTEPTLFDGVPADLVQRIPGKFLIRRKISLPVGFCDELSPKFVLESGVPFPEVGACYPAIAVEETGETLCQGDRRPCRIKR